VASDPLGFSVGGCGGGAKHINQKLAFSPQLRLFFYMY